MADDVKVKIGGDATGVKKEFDKVKGHASALKGMLVAALGAVGINLSASFLKGHIDRIDELGKKARQLGLTAEEFQKIQVAADLAGVGMDTLSTGISQMSDILGNAKNGVESANNTLHSLGYTLADFDGKSVYDQFGMVMDGIAGIADKNQQMTAIKDIFGKAGKGMVDFANNYIKSIEDARNAGTIVSDDTIKSAEEFNDALQRIELKGIAGLINSGFVGWLEKVATEMDRVVSMSAQMGKMGTKETNNESWLKRYGRAMIDWNPIGAILPNITGKKTSDYLFGAEDITTFTPAAPTLGSKKAADEAKAKEKAERAANIEIEKGQSEYAKAAEENIKAENDWRKKEEDAKGKIDETIDALNQKYQIQMLINQGKKREAEIQQAIYDAEKTAADAGLTLDPADRKDIADATGRLYDISNRQNRQFDALNMPAYSDSLSRIGGYTGSVVSGDQMINIAKKQASLLEQIKNNTMPRNQVEETY